MPKHQPTGRSRRAADLLLAVVAAAMMAADSGPVLAQAPGEPEDVLSYADLLFSKEQFSLAAIQYQVFIREQPKSPNLQAAWFRLGECYLKVDQLEDAITSFNFLINNYKIGAFVGASAYRLAVLRFNEKDYQNALAYFKVAKDELSNPEASAQAQFYYGRCLQLTAKPKEALAQFEAVIASNPGPENPFYERSLLESARLFFELGDSVKSLERFQQLAASGSTPEFKEEATVRGGLMAAEAGQAELSEKLLEEALKFPDTSPWKSLAQVGAIFNAFTRGDHDRVIGLYNTGSHQSSEESRAKMLLIVGHSYRIKGDIDSALRLYSLVEGKYPDQKEGIEAAYRKLQLLHQKGDPLLPEAVVRFADRQRKTDPENQFIDMAWLMAAEWHFNQAGSSASGPGSEFAIKHYKDAAAAYRKIRIDKIDAKYHEAKLYKQGWAEIESGNRPEGIASLSSFVEKYQTSSLSSSALAKRAMAYQSQEDHQFALGDYLDIAKRFPDAPELEFSLQQIALIYAHQRKIPEMIAAYKDLLAKFPETEGVGEARYWIGVGHFDLEQYEESLPELVKARDLDPQYDDKASLRIVIAQYQLEDIPQLAIEAKRYLEKAPPADQDGEKTKRTPIPSQVLEFLGRKLAESREYSDAEYFLTSITDPAAPEKTYASVWKLLGECRMQLKMHEGTITAYDHYLSQTERPSERAAAYLERGFAQLCLRDFEAARNSAQESLRSQKEGRTNAEARLLLGDISAANGNLEDAVRDYLVVSQIFMDPEVTPKALTKAINGYRSLGNQEQAQILTRQLSETYPDYTAPENLDREC